MSSHWPAYSWRHLLPQVSVGSSEHRLTLAVGIMWWRWAAWVRYHRGNHIDSDGTVRWRADA